MDSLIDRIRRSIAQRGFIGTIPMCWSQFVGHLRPAARKAEARREEVDAMFDSLNGVETGGIVRPKSDSVVGGNWTFGVNYQAVDPADFIEALNQISISHPEFTFIDFGSGKGRALLLASAFPFKRIIGVEYCEQLNQIARENLLRYPQAGQRCRQIEVVGADAAEYEIPDEPLLLFFHHPFDKPVMATVVKNVTDSWRKNPRRILVVYLTPYFADLWDQAGFLRRLRSSPAMFDTGNGVLKPPA